MPPNPSNFIRVIEGAPDAVKAFMGGADDVAKGAAKVVTEGKTVKSADDVAAAVADKTSKASKVKDAAKAKTGKSKDDVKKATDSAKDAAKKSKSGLLNTVKKHPVRYGLLGAGAL
ncbi:MAG: hypothetical protein KDB26_16050, partial [Microthrixaceae bacterium]|nr:hypothetical protein [Microthrixaceae bacterium]